MLEKFDKTDGLNTICGKWKIIKTNQNNHWWEIHYDGPCIIKCIDNEVEVTKAFFNFSASRRSLILNILFEWNENLIFSVKNSDDICKMKTFNILHNGGNCEQNCKYSWQSNGGICGSSCCKCGSILYLTHNNKVQCENCKNL